MTTLLAVLAIVLVFAYIAYLQNMITRKDDLIAQWESYSDQWESAYYEAYSEADHLLAELNEIQRKYGYAITSLKIAGKILPVERVKYTIGNNTAKPQTKIATQIALFDQTELFNGEFVPEFDPDGLITYSPKIATNGNGHKVESTEAKPVENTPVQSSNGDSGAFVAPTTDDKTLLASDKYGKYLDLLLADQKTKKLAAAKYEYAKSKFLQWEKSKNPNTSEEYAKRVINSKYGGK